MRTCFVFCLALSAVIGQTSESRAQEEKEAPAAVAVPATVETAPTATDSPVVKVRPLSVLVEINASTQIRGTLVDTSELPMRTSFGQAAIPLSEVAGIKFASEGNATTTVVLHNGDSITGATELDNLLVETEWGKADITGSSISSILFAQGMKWTSAEGLNGVRWTLTTPPKTPAKTTGTSSRTTGTTSRSTGSRVVPASGTRVFGR